MLGWRWQLGPFSLQPFDGGVGVAAMQLAVIGGENFFLLNGIGDPRGQFQCGQGVLIGNYIAQAAPCQVVARAGGQLANPVGQSDRIGGRP